MIEFEPTDWAHPRRMDAIVEKAGAFLAEGAKEAWGELMGKCHQEIIPTGCRVTGNSGMSVQALAEVMTAA